MASTSKFLRLHDLTVNSPKDDEPYTLKANDGLVGTIFKTSFITCHQPVKSIPPPPPESEVQVYRDGSFGPHDFVCTLQWYHESAPQLAVVPVCPEWDDIRHPLHEHRCMWDLLQPKDINFGQGVVSGVGRVSHSFLKPLIRSVNVLRVETEVYLKELPESGTGNLRNLLPLLLRCTELYMDRLSSLSKDITSLRVLTRGLQRTWLLLLAIIRYMKIYRPVMNGLPPANEDELRVKVVGVYTAGLHVVEMFLPAKVPTYFMRPWSAFIDVTIIGTCNISPRGVYILPDKPLPIVFAQGAVTMEALHAMSGYVARFVTYRDPYSFKDSKSSSTSTQENTAASSSSSARPAPGPVRQTQQNVQGRRDTYCAGPAATSNRKSAKLNIQPDLFKDVVGGDCPAIASSWTSLITEIDTQSTRFLNTRPTKHLYPIPPPSMFVDTQKAVDYFAQYHHLQNALLYQGESSAPMLRTQQWRSILGLRQSMGSTKSNSASTAAFNEVKTLLGKCFELQGVEFTESLVAPPGVVDDHQRRRILWEVSQVGFRIDLSAVDSHLYVGSTTNEHDDGLDGSLEHSNKLLSLFPEKSLTVIDSSSDAGLLAQEWTSRRPYLQKWRDIMAEWKVALPDSFKGDLPTTHEEHWERGLIKHYLQLAYNVLGRPPFILFVLY